MITLTMSTVHEKLTPEGIEQMDRRMEQARRRREKAEQEAREHARRRHTHEEDGVPK